MSKIREEAEADMALTIYDVLLSMDKAKDKFSIIRKFLGAYPIDLFQQTKGMKFLPPGDITETVLQANLTTASRTEEGYLQFSRFRDVTGNREERKRLSMWLPNIFRLDVALIDDDCMKLVESDTIYFGARNKNDFDKYVLVGQGSRLGEQLWGMNESYFRMMHSVQLTLHYTWNVLLSEQSTFMPSLALPTNVAGAKELYSSRDVPEGKMRRAALLNWVSRHTRNTVHGETSVKRHLHGAVKFIWQGLHCAILPSEYDMTKFNSVKTEEAQQIINQQFEEEISQ